MNKPFDKERERKLEELIRRELSQLPERQAPPSLIPRVMAAIQAQAHRLWWQRPFHHWPRPWQILFFATLSCLVVGLVYGFTVSWTRMAGGPMVQETRQNLAAVEVLAGTLGALTNALRLMSRTLWTHPAALAGIGIIGFVYLSCVGMGTLWYQLAFKKGAQ